MTTLVQSSIRDPALAPRGAEAIAAATAALPVLAGQAAALRDSRLARGSRVALVGALDAKAGALAQALRDAGADLLALSVSGPLVHDDVAAALDAGGATVLARSDGDFAVRAVLGAWAAEVVVGDETAAGLFAELREMPLRGIVVPDPAVFGAAPVGTVLDAGALARDALARGLAQATLQAIAATTNLVIAGKTLLVTSYDEAGHAVAAAAHAMGARVTVAESDPRGLLRAHLDGHEVAPLDDGLVVAEIVIVTGSQPGTILGGGGLARLRAGVLLADAAHPGAIDVEALGEIAVASREARPHVDEYVFPDDRAVFLLGGGQPLARAVGDGIPADLADLALASIVPAVAHLLAAQRSPGVIRLPASVEQELAAARLDAIGLGGG